MKKLIVIGGFAVLVFAAFQSVYFVAEWQQGLVFQFGEPVRVVRDPGLYFKSPIVHDLVLLDKRVLGTEPQGAEYLTLDKKRLLVDHVSRWQITDPLLFYRTVRNDAGAMARLDQVIAGRLREEIANHNFIDIVREKRESIAKRYRAEGDEKALETRAAADKQREIILATAYGQSQIERGEGDARAA